MTDNNCPICHGSGEVWYDEFTCRLPQPIPCTCCRGTGRRLWKRIDPERTRACRQAAIEACAKRGPRTGPYAKTLLALRSPRYLEYVELCRSEGLMPSSREAWIRIRHEHRNHPERVEGRMGAR